MIVKCPKCNKEELEVITIALETPEDRARLFVSKARCKNCDYKYE